jgi:N-acetyl-beta-hexosaminidase
VRTAVSRWVIAVCACAVAAFGIGIGVGVFSAHSATPQPPTAPALADAYDSIVPEPVQTSPDAAAKPFLLSSSTNITYTANAAKGVAGYLSTLFQPATGFVLPVAASPSGSAQSGGIHLALTAARTRVGAEGYALEVTADQVTIAAAAPAGLFHGAQTLRELLPPSIDSTARQPYGLWPVPAGHVLDSPRFAYRGAGLDVARHFFTVAQVERYIDEIARYKIDYLHLHLSDDQGWRIAIDGWPNLTAVGGATEVGGGAGGFYTQAEYRQLVAYAQSRFVTIIPEIDVPGHVTAALASYPQLGCTGKPTSVFTGIATGFSSLCAAKPDTSAFVHDVFTQLAAITPGPYIAVGGDEAAATKPADYAAIVGQAATAVRAAGKVPWGWQETTAVPITPPSVAGYWNIGPTPASVTAAAQAGTKVVMMPANHAYLDQKYTPATTLGLHWAGYVEVRNAYDWDPADYLTGVSPSSVLGVEADLWTETVASSADIEYMAFPRLPAIAEVGWSPAVTHNWAAFQKRLAAQGPRWKAAGIDFYASPQISWPTAASTPTPTAP